MRPTAVTQKRICIRMKGLTPGREDRALHFSLSLQLPFCMCVVACLRLEAELSSTRESLGKEVCGLREAMRTLASEHKHRLADMDAEVSTHTQRALC